jgi:hypothetical protein
MPSRKKSDLICLTLPAIGILFAGCGGAGNRIVEETFEQTYAVGPTASVSLVNADGTVRIYGADTMEVKVQAIKKAYSAERLASIFVNVSAQSGVVSIGTSYPPKKTWALGDRSGLVEYNVVVPQTCKISKVEVGNGEMLIDGMRGEGVRGKLTNGRLYARNCFGDIHLTVSNGGIDVWYGWWEQRKFSINAEIINGHIRAWIPGNASFHLMAEAKSGHVFNDFAEREQRHAGGTTRIDSVVGTNAELQVRLRTDDGNIKVGRVNF